eukprot:278141-Prymnesium_polylepis.1
MGQAAAVREVMAVRAATAQAPVARAMAVLQAAMLLAQATRMFLAAALLRVLLGHLRQVTVTLRFMQRCRHALSRHQRRCDRTCAD